MFCLKIYRLDYLFFLAARKNLVEFLENLVANILVANIQISIQKFSTPEKKIYTTYGLQVLNPIH